jgi:hypothetical protein
MVRGSQDACQRCKKNVCITIQVFLFPVHTTVTAGERRAETKKKTESGREKERTEKINETVEWI